MNSSNPQKSRFWHLSGTRFKFLTTIPVTCFLFFSQLCLKLAVQCIKYNTSKLTIFFIPRSSVCLWTHSVQYWFLRTHPLCLLCYLHVDGFMRSSPEHSLKKSSGYTEMARFWSEKAIISRETTPFLSGLFIVFNIIIHWLYGLFHFFTVVKSYGWVVAC